jgi:hypothetical protein
LQQRRLEVAAHPFFLWLNSDTVPLERRFVFSPVMIDFIMSFADMNKWFLSYEEPKDELEKGINQHTEEDRTHSRLFQDNWYTLKLGDTFHWSPGKTLWWLFDSSEAAVVRRFGMEVLDLTVNHPEPLVRFAMMEAIEICGDVFFANTAPIAQELSRRHGTNHHYFGHYHRERETGHLHTNETAFRKAELVEEQRNAAAAAVDRIFDNFLGVLDELLSYSERAVADYAALQRDIESEYLRALLPPRRTDAPVKAKALPQVRASSQLPLLRLLGQRKERLRNHPFLSWLRNDDGTAAVEKFRRFVALWGIDIVGYKDFNEMVLRYPSPRGPAELAINRKTRELATHNVLYLQDWKALRMDKFLDWDMGETIAYYFLSEQTEVHRGNMAKVKKLAFRFKEPALRFWLMTALEASGEPLFETTAALARTVEADEGLTLNYWANRHHLVHPTHDLGPDGDDHAFLTDELTEAEREVARRMIETVFDNVEEQFALSHREALSAVFVREPASLPPPRVSDRIFARSNGLHVAEAAQVM